MCGGERRMEERIKISKYLKVKIQKLAKQTCYLGNKEVSDVNQFQENY